MKVCANCGQANQLSAGQCVRCGAALPAAPPQNQAQGPASAPQPGPPTIAPGFVPGYAPKAVLPPPVFLRQQRPFTWMDIFTVLGFVAGVVGYFFASILLLPLGLVASVVGFRGDRYRGLAVAGIVISAIGVLLKLMLILQEAAWLPEWFTNGIW